MKKLNFLIRRVYILPGTGSTIIMNFCLCGLCAAISCSDWSFFLSCSPISSITS